MCHQDLSGALMTLPCCQAVIHSRCGIKSIGDQLADRYNANCVSCEALQYSLSASDDDGLPLPETPVFKEAVKSCNKFRVVAWKARSQLKRLMRERKKVFSEQVAQHIQAIKAVKKAETAALKSSDIFKAYNKAQSAYARVFSKITKDFHINTYSIKKKFYRLLKDDYLMWHYTGSQQIKRVFRLRL
jgi:hypothetical protein